MVIREFLTVFGYKTDSRKLRRAKEGVERYDKAARRAAVTNQRFSSGLGGLITRFAGLAAAALAARRLLQVNVLFEQLEGSLYTIERSFEGAQQAMDRMVRFAAETPFALEQATEAYIQLGAAGLDNSERAMRAMGDMASAFGRNISESVTAVRAAAYGEFEPLKRFGVIARVEGNQVAITMDGVTQRVSRDAQAIQDHLVNLAETRYAGQMSRQMETLGGIISNLKDNITLFLREIGKTGAADAFRAVLTEIRDMVGGAGGLAEGISAILTPALEILAGILRFVGDNMEVVKGLLYAFIAFKVIAGIQFLIGLFISMAGAVAGVTTATIGLRAAIATLLLIIPLLIEDFVTWLEGGDSMVGSFVDRFQGRDGLLGALADLANWVRTDGVEIWNDMTEAVGSAIDWMDEKFGDFFRALYGNIRQAIEGLQNLEAIRSAREAGEIVEEITELDVERAAMQQARHARAAQIQAMQRAAGWEEVEDIPTITRRLVTDEERALLRRRAALVAESERLAQAGGVAVGTEYVPMSARTGEGAGTTNVGGNANVSVGEVRVEVAGTANMSPEQFGSAVEAGFDRAFGPVLRQVERMTSGSGRVFE
jgi:hypothetical protein